MDGRDECIVPFGGPGGAEAGCAVVVVEKELARDRLFAAPAYVLGTVRVEGPAASHEGVVDED